MYVFGYEYGTPAIKVCQYFNFAVVFSSTYFRFPLNTDKLLGDFHVNRRSEQIHLTYNAPILPEAVSVAHSGKNGQVRLN